MKFHSFRKRSRNWVNWQLLFAILSQWPESRSRRLATSGWLGRAGAIVSMARFMAGVWVGTGQGQLFLMPIGIWAVALIKSSPYISRKVHKKCVTNRPTANPTDRLIVPQLKSTTDYSYLSRNSIRCLEYPRVHDNESLIIHVTFSPMIIIIYNFKKARIKKS